MNDTIKTLLNHRTYRHFDENYQIPTEELDLILQSAKQAPSWMNGQHYSIIRVTDKPLRQYFGKLQAQMGSCSELLIFVADLYRMSLASHAYDADFIGADTTEALMIASCDTSFAAQNALVAAESLGYGTCYIGGIRRVAKELISLLDLPKYTFPLFALCVGKPAIEMKIKPRLPQEAVVFENQYQSEFLKDNLNQYEETMLAFAEARETLPWCEKFARFYAQEHNPVNKTILLNQGLLSKD